LDVLDELKKRAHFLADLKLKNVRSNYELKKQITRYSAVKLAVDPTEPRGNEGI